MGTEYLISNFLRRFKRPIVLNPVNEYKLVTISSKHRGIKLRELKIGSLIKSKMYEVRAGDFVLSGIDARNGAFGIIPQELDRAIITNDFWCLEINDEVISKELFLELTATNWFDELCNRGSDGTTNRVRLQKHKFFNQKVTLPFKEQQKGILNKLLNVKERSSSLNKEIDHQKNLTNQLKQSILQEAIQGKLSADWREQNPSTEPASELLKRIKAEKNQLIKDKKIKKEKPIPPITKEEIPFELPENWTWCRLGEVIISSDNLNIHKALSPNELINYVDIDAIDNKLQTIRELKTLPVNQLSSRARRVLKEGNIMYSLVRPYLHNLAIVEDEKENYIGSTGFAVFHCLLTENKYVFLLLLTKYIEDIYLGFMDGFNSPSITHAQFKSTITPLPPLEEQKIIVEKAGILMQKCKSLEQEVKTSESNAQMLMQAVLKEAFEGKDEEVVES